MTQPHDTASDVAAEDGVVIVTGPDGIAYTMTPDAARETGRRLADAADEAHAQIGDARFAPRRRDG